jgi:putative endopeptidase
MDDWWSPSVRQVFEEKAQCVVDLYDSYQPLPGLHINGKLTEGENLAGNQHLCFVFLLIHLKTDLGNKSVCIDNL